MKPPKNHHSLLKSGNTPLVFGVLDTLHTLHKQKDGLKTTKQAQRTQNNA